MTGKRPFTVLTTGFSPERKARVAARVSQLKADMPLRKLHQARELNVEQSGEFGTASDQPGGSS
jgi:hypothetical protein